MVLTVKGIDSHNRPVYEDYYGHIWKDVDPRPDRPPMIYSALCDNYDGEPDILYHGEVIFNPCRVTWQKIETQTFTV